jgi:hypothetical protein
MVVLDSLVLVQGLGDRKEHTMPTDSGTTQGTRTRPGRQDPR